MLFLQGMFAYVYLEGGLEFALYYISGARRGMRISTDGTCTRDPNMNLIIQYGLLGLVLGLGLGFILY